MPDPSPLYYFALMAMLILAGWTLSKSLPFHRRANVKDLSLQRVVPLDGLRGILALSVFVTHVAEVKAHEATHIWKQADSNFYAQLGYIPVTMFFFITGYVFWQKMIKTPRIHLGPFLLNRLARLGGAYVLALIFCFFFIALESNFHRNVPVRTLVLQGLSWLGFFGTGHDINNIFFSRRVMGVAWTLQKEWFFYLSLPFFTWFARRRQRLALLLLTAATASVVLQRLPVSGVAKFIITATEEYTAFLAYTFSVGMAMAAIQFSPKVRAWAQTNVAAAVSLAFIGVTAFWAVPKYGWYESLLLAIPFACLCMGNTLFGLLSSAPVRFLGRISYSFYLLHFVLLALEMYFLRPYIDFAALRPFQYFLFAACSGTVAIVVSAFSYQFLEHPFLHVGRTAKARAGNAYPAANSMHDPVGQAARS
jgi:peptidoglycan/LPS O-acetylase OafA/YrhL